MSCVCGFDNLAPEITERFDEFLFIRPTFAMDGLPVDQAELDDFFALCINRVRISMGNIKSGTLEPAAPLVSQLMRFDDHGFPLNATIREVNVTSVLALFDFAPKLLHHVCVLFGFCRILKMHRLPLRPLKRNRLFTMGMIMSFMPVANMIVAFMSRLNFFGLASSLGLRLCRGDAG
jgi:hypothetical protein